MREMSVLLIDDDENFCQIMRRRLQHHGLSVDIVFDSAAALLQQPASYDVILLDMMIGSENGIELIQPLIERYSPNQLYVLTGYASVATTVEAMKRGADDYLAKPVSSQDIIKRLSGEGAQHLAQAQPLSPAQVEWEYIQRILLENQGNISKTARELGMHRRTLQRKLAKKAPQ